MPIKYKPRKVARCTILRKLQPYIPCKATTRQGTPCKAIKTYYCPSTDTWKCKNHGGMIVRSTKDKPMTRAIRSKLQSLKRERSEIERAALMIRLGLVK